MATQRLTTKFVESVKAAPKRQSAHPDGQVPGLELRVSANGRKVWSYRYRTLAGVQRRMTLGIFPSVDVGDARAAALTALGVIAGGGDPANDKRKAKAAEANRKIRSFDDLADDYLAACETGRWRPKNKTKRASTLADETATLKRHVRPKIGKRDLAEITRRDVRQLLAKMFDSGIGARTNKTHAIIRQVFAYAVSEELVQVNPAVGFPPLADQKPRVRTLTDDELQRWWNTLERWPNNLRGPPAKGETEGALVTVGRPMRIALQLATLLLQRRGEIAGMAMSELNLGEAVWLIPGERAKNGKPHLVPLPPRAVELIKEALVLAKAGRKKTPAHVFPSRHTGGPFHPDSLTHAMAELTAALAISGASPHDLRRTGSTALTSERIAVSPFIRSKVLGHTSDAGGGSAVSAAHYDANEYVAEKRRALEAWEGLLLEVAGERAGTPSFRATTAGVR